MLALCLSANAGKDPGLHKGLHAAAEDPNKPPPPLLFGSDEKRRLEAGEVLFDFEHIRGHELATAAILSRATPEALWDQILDIEEYERINLVESAKIDARVMEGKREVIDGTLNAKLPGIPAVMPLRAYYEADRGYMPYHLVSGKGSPFRHVVGYWSVAPFDSDHVLVLLMMDAQLDVPLPLSTKEELCGQALPLLIESVARDAERRPE